MKKLVTLLLIGTLVVAGSVYAFAEDTVVCELDPEVAERITAIKDEFLAEKVADGTITQTEADALEATLETREGHDELRDLGFGIWLQDNDYMDELFDILPRKGGRDMTKGRMNTEDMTEEELAELQERHEERIESGDFRGRMDTEDMTEEELAEFEARRAEMLESGNFMGRSRMNTEDMTEEEIEARKSEMQENGFSGRGKRGK